MLFFGDRYIGVSDADRLESLHDGRAPLYVPDNTSPLLVAIFSEVTKCVVKEGAPVDHFYKSLFHHTMVAKKEIEK